jgi:hypothetical protein
MIWSSKPSDRARRDTEHEEPETAADPATAAGAFESSAPGSEPGADLPARIDMSRREVDRFAAALAASLGPAETRLDSPARIASALDVLIELVGGGGSAVVVRRPAGLSTPESREVRLENADGTSRLLLDHLGRGLPLQTSDAGAVA